MRARPTGRTSVAWTLVVTSAATFMAALDNLVVTTALPAIGADLGADLGDLEWIVNGYTLPFACLLLLAAALGDRFGRRRIFAGGVALFTAASVAAAAATSAGTLIAARAGQGVGAAVLMPLSLTLIAAAVPAGRRGMAFGIWGAINGVAIASGPLVGGTITEHLSWHWIFLLNVPIGIVLIPLVLTRLAESHGANRRLDLIGTGLASTGLLGLVSGIVRGHEHGWTSEPVLGGMAVGGLLLAVFVWWERRAPAPMVPMRFFRSRTFSGINAAGLLMFLGAFGSIFLLTQFLQFIQGYSPQEAGLRMLPWTAMPLAVAPVAGALSDRVSGRPVVIAGFLTMAAGLSWFALVVAPDVSYLAQVPALVLCGTGMAMFFAPSGAVLMGSVAPAEQGIASGVNNALREVGGALGVATLASVFAANGSHRSGQAFTDGLVPALWVGVASLLAAALAATAIRRRTRPVAGAPAPGAGRPEPGAGEPGPVMAVAGRAEGA